MNRLPLRLWAVVVCVMLSLGSAPRASQQQKSKKKEKIPSSEIHNFDGGIVFATDGGLSELTCFRLDGRVTAGHFFDDFKRIDDEHGTQYRSNQEMVTEFPTELQISFMIVDMPCRIRMQQPSPRVYLTEEMMKSLRFTFYWKRGIELHHIERFKLESATEEPIAPYNAESKEELPKHSRWILEYTIPSAGVPLTDRLVLIIRTPDGHRAARVAARL